MPDPHSRRAPLGKPGKQRGGTRRATGSRGANEGRPVRTSHDDANSEGKAIDGATADSCGYPIRFSRSDGLPRPSCVQLDRHGLQPR